MPSHDNVIHCGEDDHETKEQTPVVHAHGRDGRHAGEEGEGEDGDEPDEGGDVDWEAPFP